MATKRVFELFVSRVPWTVTSREVKTYFNQFGDVKRCVLPFDKLTGFNRSFCWVEFSSEGGMHRALEKDRHILEGSQMNVQQKVLISPDLLSLAGVKSDGGAEPRDG